MAKKSIKVNPNVAADVPSGDVNITYDGTRIAGISETTTARLETEDTVVKHDIVVDYTKPEAPSGITTPPTFSLTRSGLNYESWEFTCSPLVDVNDNIISESIALLENVNVECYYIPFYNLADTTYTFHGMLKKDGSRDELDVTANDNVVPYDSMFGRYIINVVLPTYDTPVVISITDKVS